MLSFWMSIARVETDDWASWARGANPPLGKLRCRGRYLPRRQRSISTPGTCQQGFHSPRPHAELTIRAPEAAALSSVRPKPMKCLSSPQ